jgi:dipeptidyl aminopeptidase/acylaminoacyl peptidase
MAGSEGATALEAGEAGVKAQRKKNFDVETLWKIERAGAVSLSPDGAQAACSLTTFSMAENKGSTHLWLLSTFGGEPRRLTSCGDKDGQAAWSPTGAAIAFVARREQEGKKDETAQLYLITPDGGEARRVSDFAPGIEAFKWFPDGKRIAFIAWVWPELKGTKAQAGRWKQWKERKESGYATAEAQYRFWDRNLPMGRVAHLHVLDVESGRVVDLFESTPCELQRMDPDANVFDIAPDGRHIVFVFDPAVEKRPDHCKALAEINVKTGRVATIARDAAWDFEAPRYGPDGAHIAFLAAAHRRLGPLGQRTAALVAGRRRAVLHRRGSRPLPSLALRARQRQRRRRRRRRMGPVLRRGRRYDPDGRRLDAASGAGPRAPDRRRGTAHREIQRRPACGPSPRRARRKDLRRRRRRAGADVAGLPAGL